MIRLGLRLTLNGGREAVVRLVVTAAAVALGACLLLTTLAGINAVNAQNGRYAWLETGVGPSSATPGSATDPAWWLLSADTFRGDLIGRIDVAATGPHAPVPPGIPALPGPGQFYASPALATILRATPADELGARFPGRQIGTIGAAGLPDPGILIIVVGRTVADASHLPGAARVTTISTTTPSSCTGTCYFIGIDAAGIDLILAVAAAAMLFPVALFIGTATRLSAATREQRFAAMRLVGATPRQVSVISAVESTVGAAAGSVAGFGLFFLLRPALARIPFTGARFYTADLSLNVIDIAVVAVGVPVAAAIAARLALRRVTISPLGVTRRVTLRPPRAWRLIPLLLGVGELAWFVYAGRPATTPRQTQVYTVGILLMLAGLVVAGPWLTMVGSRLMARFANRPATLMAGRRLADDPRKGFRAVSGLVVALFVTSVAIGMMTTINAYTDGDADRTPAAHGTLVDDFDDFSAAGPLVTSIASVPAALLGTLRSVPGVEALTLIHQDPADHSPFPGGVVSCAALARTPAFGHCRGGAETASISAYFGGRGATTESSTWPAAALSSGQLDRLPVQTLAIATDGSARAIERARTLLALAYPTRYPPSTIAEQNARNQNVKLNDQYRQLVDVVIATSLVIAGCALAVSVAGGLAERKRPFSLLRLTGAPLGVLRRVVGLESALPLLVTAALSIAAGFLAAGLFLTSQLDETLQPPGAGYYLTVVAGLLVSLAVIAATLPLLSRITGPDVARND